MEKDVEVQKVIGTPTMLLLPARHYAFTVSKQEYTLVLPRKGKYADLDSNASEEDGGFEILASDGKLGQTLYIPSISKVLFATKQYPDLKEGEAFSPMAIKFTKDEVIITGYIITMMREKEIE
jgi:hypothetical protein